MRDNIFIAKLDIWNEVNIIGKKIGYVRSKLLAPIEVYVEQ